MEKGIITKVSNQDFDNTYLKLKETIDNNPNLKIIAELDHQSNASNVGLALNKTKIILFGNPKMGTPLMQNSITAGLDLPQKILVYQNDQGIVNVTYNDPMYLKQRHGISGAQEILTKISGALDQITNLATL
ncbi:MAG: DUF302 domain-containing protein [Bacteroidota bacterium]